MTADLTFHMHSLVYLSTVNYDFLSVSWFRIQSSILLSFVIVITYYNCTFYCF